MQLSPTHRRMLAQYQWHHANPMTAATYWIATLWRSSRLLYISLFILAVLVVVARTAGAGPWIYIVIGVVLGYVGHEILYQRQAFTAWSLLDSIIDWQTVARMLGNDGAPAPDSSSAPERDA